MKRIKLFCLPFAGSSAMFYYSWQRRLHPSIELRPIEIAGRGKRNNELFYDSIAEAVKDILEKIKEELDSSSFAFYGHSMGTLLVYEVIHQLVEETQREPIHSFFTGRYPPHVGYKGKRMHKLPDNEFLEELNKIGGTSAEFFANKELIDLFLPILRADYKIVEEYEHKPKERKFNHEITVIGGKKDEHVTLEDLNEWRAITNKTCNVYQLDGGHFFIKELQDNVVDLINFHLVHVC